MDATTLRLLLGIAGGLLLVGLYLRERRRARSAADDPYEDELADEDKLEPRIGAWDDEATDEIDDELAAETDIDDTFDDLIANGDDREGPEPPDGDLPRSDRREPHWSEPDLPPVSDPPRSGPDWLVPDESGPVRPRIPLILSLHITPPAGTLDGEAIVHAASRCQLEPGEGDIFHHYSATGTAERPLFSMANMVNPGTFPFGTMADFESPGLTLFSQADGASDDPARLEVMLTTARCLAAGLKAEVRDETRKPLTPEAEQRLRDRVDELVAWRLTDGNPG